MSVLLLRRAVGPVALLVVVTVVVLVVRGALGGRHVLGTGTTSTTVRAQQRTTAKAPARRYWVVRAGDTLGLIAARTRLSVAKLQALNPRVSPTALYIGERIRVR